MSLPIREENGGAHVAGLAKGKAAHMGIEISAHGIAMECKMGGIEGRDGNVLVGAFLGPAMAQDAAPPTQISSSQERPPSRDSGTPPSPATLSVSSSAGSRAATPTSSAGSRAATPLPSLSSNPQEASIMTWTHEAILLLIEEHLRKKEHFAYSTYRKVQVWALVAAALREKGHQGATADGCDKKWRNLKMSYKTNREKAKKSGAGRFTWAYYDLMDDQLFHDPGIQPSRTAGSLCGVQPHTERPRFRRPPSAEDEVLSESSSSSGSSPSQAGTSELDLDPAQPGPSTGASQAHCQPGTSHGRSSASPGRSGASPAAGKGRKRRASWMSDPPQWFLEQTEVLRQIAGTLESFVKHKQDMLRRLEDQDKH